MKFLSAEECVEWCSQCGYKVIPDSDNGSMAPDFDGTQFHKLEYQLPPDSGEKVALARSVLMNFNDSPEVLLWQRNWKVWPSSGHMPLVMRIRQALGEMRPIEETPGYLVTADAYHDAASLLLISMEFFWDCWVLASEGRRAFFTSHDEYFIFFADSESTVERFRQDIDVGNRTH